MSRRNVLLGTPKAAKEHLSARDVFVPMAAVADRTSGCVEQGVRVSAGAGRQLLALWQGSLRQRKRVQEGFERSQIQT